MMRHPLNARTALELRGRSPVSIRSCKLQRFELGIASADIPVDADGIPDNADYGEDVKGCEQ